ncbi:hypothetical protein L484_006088 [Morus notabilis]|uniref:Uncharacterized protein n=1 Tax=Morus notabilis TaxID=981085 RepID=W9S2Y0_9ROSA|nr:hypothetical protein L484_006088 [Morus notabilis]
MQAEQNPQSWRIEVRAKARNFNFKFNATKLSPTWKFHRLSLLLKLHSFFLGLNSHSSPSIPTQPQQQTLKSKLRGILSKIRSKTTKKWPNRRKSKTNSALNRLRKYTKEKPICFGSLLALILGLVIRKREIFVYFLGILACIALLLLKKFESNFIENDYDKS